jgi:hypothetical protein
MRTTLDIEDDVLLAAVEIARRRGLSLGKVVSNLVRQALAQQTETATRHGVPLFPIRPDAGIVTLETVKQLQNAMT